MRLKREVIHIRPPKYDAFLKFLKPLTYGEVILLILCSVIYLRDNNWRKP